MTVKELIKLVDGKLLCGDPNISFREISTDTRTIEDSNLFIALKGKQFNGNDYLDEAIKKGCKVIITENDIVKDVPVIKVNDSHLVLFLLANYYRNKYKVPLIAVTGSVGKTLTKELISKILSMRYNVLKSPKNHNNHIGIPQTLFKLDSTHQIIVCEFGMNHLNEISNLSKLCEPDVGIITNVGTSHIGNLGSKKEILRAKSEIIDGMRSGPLVINGDDQLLKKIKYNNIIKCGLNRKNDLIAYDIKEYVDRTCFKVIIDNEICNFVLHIPGKHLVMDVLLAIQVGLLFNIKVKDIITAIFDFEADDQRMKIIKINNNTIIDDSYNASYESFMGGLDVVKNNNEFKIIILGDMLELGKYSFKYHKKVIKKTKKIANCFILLVGDNFSKIPINRKNIIHFNNLDDLKLFFDNFDFERTLFYIKGSHKMQLEKIVEYLKKDNFLSL